MAKRRIPVKHFPTNEEFQNFIESEKDWMYTHIINSIEKAFFEGSDYAEIMEAKISASMSTITMKSQRYEWVTSLKLAMKWYEDEEKYERCIEILKLIKSIQEEI
jgi:hypothetical protein